MQWFSWLLCVDIANKWRNDPGHLRHLMKVKHAQKCELERWNIWDGGYMVYEGGLVPPGVTWYGPDMDLLPPGIWCEVRHLDDWGWTWLLVPGVTSPEAGSTIHCHTVRGTTAREWRQRRPRLSWRNISHTCTTRRAISPATIALAPEQYRYRSSPEQNHQ